MGAFDSEGKQRSYPSDAELQEQVAQAFEEAEKQGDEAQLSVRALEMLRKSPEAVETIKTYDPTVDITPDGEGSHRQAS